MVRAALLVKIAPPPVAGPEVPARLAASLTVACLEEAVVAAGIRGQNIGTDIQTTAGQKTLHPEVLAAVALCELLGMVRHSLQIRVKEYIILLFATGPTVLTGLL